MFLCLSPQNPTGAWGGAILFLCLTPQNPIGAWGVAICFSVMLIYCAHVLGSPTPARQRSWCTSSSAGWPQPGRDLGLSLLQWFLCLSHLLCSRAFTSCALQPCPGSETGAQARAPVCSPEQSQSEHFSCSAVLTCCAHMLCCHRATCSALQPQPCLLSHIHCFSTLPRLRNWCTRWSAGPQRRVIWA